MGVSSAEVFDPKTGTFDLTGSMSTERYACPAVSLRMARSGSRRMYAHHVHRLHRGLHT